jgi:hypothetical protein
VLKISSNILICYWRARRTLKRRPLPALTCGQIVKIVSRPKRRYHYWDDDSPRDLVMRPATSGFSGNSFASIRHGGG